ncbi:MAG: aminoacyl-tRNA hydrolase [Deltaproteobacteria bacterium]|nr:aminoacyl-tRNA hydrolase [Deltaproteobacteria bacterium]
MTDFLIVGLGNPGRKYQQHRHNIGFRVIEVLAEKAGIPIRRKRCNAEIGEGRIGAAAVILAKPQTFMNRSGDAVACLCSRRKAGRQGVIIVHDDLDLEPGRIKIKDGGGHGGHNGLRSIIERLGSGDFIRIRIGIGRPEGGLDPADYVLGNFSQPAVVKEWIAGAVEITEFLLQHGLQESMNRYH